jgi:hypothetical protein
MMWNRTVHIYVCRQCEVSYSWSVDVCESRAKVVWQLRARHRCLDRSRILSRANFHLLGVFLHRVVFQNYRTSVNLWLLFPYGPVMCVFNLTKMGWATFFTNSIGHPDPEWGLCYVTCLGNLNKAATIRSSVTREVCEKMAENVPQSILTKK